MKQAIQVASRPAKPLMIYDGDCNFCKFWIARWQRATGTKVDYVESQNPRVAEQLPEVPREWFDTSVQLVETDGKVYDGAEAVFRSLTYSRFWRWAFWWYRFVPGFAPITECAYRFVAKRRQFFSWLTRLFFGRSYGN